MKPWMGMLFALVGLSACDHVAPLPAAVVDGGIRIGWTPIEAGKANLNAISGVSEDAIWVVGDSGTIWLWNGKDLVAEKSGTTVNLRGVWALDADDAYAVGDGGTILQRTVGGWQQVGVGLTRQVLTAVWADTTRVVAVGSAATVVYGSMATGYEILPVGTPTMPITENLFAVTGVVGGQITAVGALGLMLQISATSVTRVPIPAFSKVLAGATTGPTASYFVGQQGTVYINGANGLNLVTGCPASALRAVSTIDSAAWIAGWDGVICQITADGNAISYPYTDSRWFNGIYAAAAGSIWVVGASGTLIHGFPKDPSDGGAPGLAP